MIPKGIPLPDSGLPWEGRVDSSLTAQLGETICREGPAPTPSTGEATGCSKARPRPSPGSALRAEKLQTSHFTSLSPSSHPENEVRSFLLT